MSAKSQLARNCLAWLESVNLHPFDHSVGVTKLGPGRYSVGVLVKEDMDGVIRILGREQEFFMWRDTRTRTQGGERRGFVEFIRHGKQVVLAEMHNTTGGTFLTLSELSFPKSI